MWRHLFSQSRRRAGWRRQRFHPHVELLERRTLLSTLTVTNLDDSGPGSLRQAILDANSPVYPDADTINLSVVGTIDLASALPDLNSNMAIEGPGAAALTVRRNSGGNYRIFTVTSGANVSLSDLTIADGMRSGVSNDGTLTLYRTIVSGNVAGDFGGGDIHNSGTLTLNDTTIHRNGSTTRGGMDNTGTAMVK